MGTMFELSRIGAERTLNHGWAPRLQYDYASHHVGALDVADAVTGAPQLVVDLYDPDDPRLWAEPVGEVSIGYLVPGERVVPALGRPVDGHGPGVGEAGDRSGARPPEHRISGTRAGTHERRLLLSYLPLDVIAVYTALVVLLRGAGALTLQWLTGITVAVAVVFVAVQAWITARRVADQHRTGRPSLLRAVIGSWWELSATAIAVVVWSAALPGSWAAWSRFGETLSFGGWTAADSGIVAFATVVVVATLLLLGTGTYQEVARGRATRAVLRRPDVAGLDHGEGLALTAWVRNRLARRRTDKKLATNGSGSHAAGAASGPATGSEPTE